VIILGIETSCDETSAAVVANGREVRSNIIASQVEVHAPHGGVVPELAARRHIEAIGFIVARALADAGVTLADIDAFAVATGPGLAGALLVGLNYAKGLAWAGGKPLIGVHHVEAHVCANYLTHADLQPPFLSLVVSGGHTLLIAVRDYDKYEVLGSTRDDAAGEAFDKVARVLGLPYPGGPQIDKLAEQGCPTAIHFPRAKMAGYDFSFSGLKTAVVQYMAKNPEANRADVAASFRAAAVDALVNRTVDAARAEGFGTIALAGGVACNIALRNQIQSVANLHRLGCVMPTPILCTDNAAMVASRGFFALKDGKRDGPELNAYPSRMTN
jgi:N6-L-threonylcarbamoyladenine synthase